MTTRSSTPSAGGRVGEWPRVVRAAGREAESELTYAGLHQLCATMLGPLGRLPEPQRERSRSCSALRSRAGSRSFPGRPRGARPAHRGGRRAPAGLRDRRRPVAGPGVAAGSRVRVAAAVGPVSAGDLHRPRADCRADGDPRAGRAPSAGRAPGGVPAPAGPRELAGLPELAVGGLSGADAGELLASVVRWPLDARVREQIVLETRGNPAALLGSLRALSPGQLAGGFRLPGAADGIPGSLLGRLDDLPAATGRCCWRPRPIPTGDPALVRRAAGRPRDPGRGRRTRRRGRPAHVRHAGLSSGPGGALGGLPVRPAARPAGRAPRPGLGHHPHERPGPPRLAPGQGGGRTRRGCGGRARARRRPAQARGGLRPSPRSSSGPRC